MKKIDYNYIIFIDNDEEIFNSGSYGIIRRCIIDDKVYACKSFENNNYLNGKKRKLELLSDIEDKNLLLPKYWTKDKNDNTCYLAPYKKSKGLDYYDLDPIKTRLSILKQTKKVILRMHDYGIIHSDLYAGNILVNNDDTFIIDFDNCTFNKYKTNILDSNDYCQEFIKKYGICKELDIHMFNLLTYSFLNELDYYKTRYNILVNGIKFQDKESIKICNSLFLEDKYPNKDFLIDTIDETSFQM